MNWMRRDILYAKEVRKQCWEKNFCSLVNDGSMSIEKMTERVETHFGLVDARIGKGEKRGTAQSR